MTAASDTRTAGVDALTEKERQTLRLLLHGHDAKSIARHLGLSVHTINERLRDARRKLSVSSSREAARLLHQREAATPENPGDSMIGDAPAAAAPQPADPPDVTAPAPRRAARAIGGVAMLSLLAAALALLAPAPEAPGGGAPSAAAPADTAAAAAARDWLALVDAGNWADSYAATTTAFRAANTLAMWRGASEKARVPLGRLVSRTLVAEHDVPARPDGVRMVRFRTDFANRAGATETLSLEREGGAWRVAGIYIE